MKPSSYFCFWIQMDSTGFVFTFTLPLVHVSIAIYHQIDFYIERETGIQFGLLPRHWNLRGDSSERPFLLWLNWQVDHPSTAKEFKI